MEEVILFVAAGFFVPLYSPRVAAGSTVEERLGLAVSAPFRATSSLMLFAPSDAIANRQAVATASAASFVPPSTLLSMSYTCSLILKRYLAAYCEGILLKICDE